MCAVGFGTIALGVFSGAAGATPAADGTGGVTNNGTVNVVDSHQGNCSSLQVVQTGNGNSIGSDNGNGNGNINVGNNTPPTVGRVPAGTAASLGGTPVGPPGGGASPKLSISTNNGNGNGNGNGITQKAANCNTVVTPTVTKTVVVPQTVTKTVVVPQTVTKTVVVPQTTTVVQQAPVASAVTTTAHFTG
jgi:hypothetical protein